MSSRVVPATIGLSLLVITGFLIWMFQQDRLSTAEVIIAGTAVPPLPALDQQAIADGEALYQQYCATCHGIDLRGVPDWKTPLADGSFPPPPHDDSGHTWHHPDFLLLQIMAEGGQIYDGAMPAFLDQLSKSEMQAILEFIKSRWNRESREYQWWLTNTYPTPTATP